MTARDDLLAFLDSEGIPHHLLSQAWVEKDGAMVNLSGAAEAYLELLEEVPSTAELKGRQYVTVAVEEWREDEKDREFKVVPRGNRWVIGNDKAARTATKRDIT